MANFKTYYYIKFRKDINRFFSTIPDSSKFHEDTQNKQTFSIQYERLTPAFGHLNFLDNDEKEYFAVALYLTVLTDMVRYTRSFRSRIAVTDENGSIRYFKTTIENSYWNNAIQFTKNAANLSLFNENEFIDKYIISECERMVNGLELFYRETEFDFINENQINIETINIIIDRVDIKGYDLIDFRTEKIVGALDFLTKINEYNSIIPTSQYCQRIITLNKKFIPNVYKALEYQNLELIKAKEKYNEFIIKHNQLIGKNQFYQTEKYKLKADFDIKYKVEYSEFLNLLTKSHDELKHHNHKIKLHSDITKKLNEYINKYKTFVKE